MNTTLASIAHDKRWWYAGGVVGAVALYALYQRRKGTGPTSASPAAGSPGYAGAGLGAFDSTGTDIAAQLGQFGGSLQNQLDQYQKQLTDALGGLAQVPPGNTPPGKGPQWINIFGGEHVDDFINTLNKLGNPITYQQLVDLNPQLPQWIQWNQKPVPGQPGQYTHADNTFAFNTALRLY